MITPKVSCTHLAGAAHLPLLVVGPSLGTSVEALWAPAAQYLRDTHCVIGWDLPGHGASPTSQTQFTIADLARGVAAVVESQWGTGTFIYAGVSIAGAVGLELLLGYSGRIAGAALICTGAVIGSAADWQTRAQVVQSGGTSVMVQGAQSRWFTAGFADREPSRVAVLLDSLREADDESYAMCCKALAKFDVRDLLPSIQTPVLAIAGSNDFATPPDLLLELSTRVRNGRFVELPGTAHLPPAERPRRIAQLVAALTKETAR